MILFVYLVFTLLFAAKLQEKKKESWESWIAQFIFCFCCGNNQHPFFFTWLFINKVCCFLFSCLFFICCLCQEFVNVAFFGVFDKGYYFFFCSVCKIFACGSHLIVNHVFFLFCLKMQSFGSFSTSMSCCWIISVQGLCWFSVL